jgi:hypothetical protein
MLIANELLLPACDVLLEVRSLAVRPELWGKTIVPRSQVMAGRAEFMI